jgi:hypothetical protein
VTDKQKTLEHLEAEQRGRALGLVGAAATTAGEWLQWLWTTPGVMEGMKSRPQAEAPARAPAPPTNTRAAYTTTYSRVTTPKSDEPSERDPESLEWHRFFVTTANPTDTHLGAVEEASYAVDGDELVIADLEGRVMGTQRLDPGADPARAARQMLRERAPKRTPLVFPSMGVA